MIWIVSKSVIASNDELECRHQYIQEVSSADVSPWTAHKCPGKTFLNPPIEYFVCISKKGEYGVVITAHIDEVSLILLSVLSDKKALVFINSCAINTNQQLLCLNAIKCKNRNSELFFAKQKTNKNGVYINYIDDVGTFGFGTTLSDRELFQNRRLGLINALRSVYCKVKK